MRKRTTWQRDMQYSNGQNLWMQSANCMKSLFLLIMPSLRKEARNLLREWVREEKAPLKIAISTCGGFIFLIGCHCEQLFLVDTYPIGPDLGENGNGKLKVYPANESESIHQLCVWIWKRLQISGVRAESMQSLMNITEVSRYDSVYFGRF